MAFTKQGFINKNKRLAAAEAIRIENGSLTTTYIQYLWVRQQNNIPDKVVYIPTEANMPILEAKK